MHNLSAFFMLVLCCFAWMSCKDDEEEIPTHSFSYEFEEGSQGWVGGFADYPADWDENRFDFRFEHADLPEEVGLESKAMLISGTNISDDLFMFMKKEISGLRPDHEYLLRVEIELASQYPEESVGIGGSPGGSVYLKAGGSTAEPQAVPENGEIRMNIDKGNQSQRGEQMVVTGTVGIPGEEFTYMLINRDNLQQPVRVRSDASGSLWVIVGTDSGFEGTTTLFYNSIAISLEE
jgi:hypothetical protein